DAAVEDAECAGARGGGDHAAQRRDHAGGSVIVHHAREHTRLVDRARLLRGWQVVGAGRAQDTPVDAGTHQLERQLPGPRPHPDRAPNPHAHQRGSGRAAGVVQQRVIVGARGQIGQVQHEVPLVLLQQPGRVLGEPDLAVRPQGKGLVADLDRPPPTEFALEIVRERSEEHTSELQSRFDLVCRLLLEKKNVYLVKDGIYKTHAISTMVLNGITCRRLLKLFKEQDHACKDVEITKYALYGAEEVYLRSA